MIQDLRYALRQLIRRPLFTVVAVITLALGIGATTTIFSVVDHLILRDLSFPDPDRVVTVWQDNRRENLPLDDVAPANFLDWKERNRVFEAIGAAEPYSVDLTGPDFQPEVIFAANVTEGFFEALGVAPARGRLLQSQDFREESGRVAVMGHGLWQQRFGGDPDIVGRALTLDGDPYVIVGILPQDFDLGLMYSVQRRELWLPRVLQGWEEGARSSSWWSVVARVKPGTSLAQAQADMDRVAANLATEYPVTNDEVGVTVVPLHEHLVGNARPTLLILLGAVAIVLLIACANVAHLQLARGTERVDEFAVRAALGGERSRLIRQLLTESLVLALLGTVAGLAVAYWGVDVVKVLSPGDIPRMDAVSVDVRILVFAVGIAVFTAVIFGLAPALQFSSPRLLEALKEGRIGAGKSRARVRGGLIMAETALALTLLIGAGLLIRSFMAILAVDPGFRTENVIAAQVFYYEDGHTAQDRIEFFRETVERIETLPAVRTAGAVSAAPFLAANIDIRQSFVVTAEPTPRAGEEPQGYISVTTPRYFETMGIPLLRGRVFTDFDRSDAPGVAVINETLRRRYWPSEDPVGKSIRIGTAQQSREIVGVVGDVRHTGLDEDPRPEIFVPHAQAGSGSMTYFVRTSGDPAAVLQDVQQVVWDLAPLQTFYQTGTVNGLISRTLTGRRFSLLLLNIFAAIALLMAAVGIYGVMSFSVTQRTHEVGIRMALGADRDDVVRMVVGEGMKLAAAGVALGLVVAAFGTQVLSSLLFGIPPRDSVAFVLAVLVLVIGALIASYVPARRATRVDPMEALRYE